MASTLQSRPGSASTAETTRSRKGSSVRAGQPCGAQPMRDQARITDCTSVVAIMRQMTTSPPRPHPSVGSTPMCRASAAAAGSSSSKPQIHAVSGIRSARCDALGAQDSRETSRFDPAETLNCSGRRRELSSASPGASESGSPEPVVRLTSPESTCTIERSSVPRWTTSSTAGRMRCCARMVTATELSRRSRASSLMATEAGGIATRLMNHENRRSPPAIPFAQWWVWKWMCVVEGRRPPCPRWP